VTSDVLQGENDWLIALALLILTIVVTEIGFRSGRRVLWDHPDGAKDQVTAITTGALGLLVFLMALTFVMAVTRFEARKQLVLDEANAIGTTYLRGRLLPAPEKRQVSDLLRRYVDVRLELYGSGEDPQKRAKAIADSERMRGELWAQADVLSEKRPDSVPVGLFVQSLNDTFDLRARRLVARDDHVPPTVLFVLFLATVTVMALVGYGNGLYGRRNFVVTTLLSFLVAAVTLVILDLDRPERGFIRVSQDSMQRLQQELRRSVEAGR
jgi:hypothetical protein